MDLFTIEGYIENFRFLNNENCYAVFDFVCEDDDIGEIVCKGTIAGAQVGDYLKLTGGMEDHKNYGPQFKFVRFEVLTQKDILSVERYLASGAVKGVGPALALRIVRKFEEDTLRIMEEEPERLAEVKGISERKAREIAVQFMEKKDVRDAMMFLQQYGISNTLAVRIFDTYGIAMYSILKQNPYKMAEDLPGVGFKTADEMATQMGIRVDSDYRIRCGILHVLTMASYDGHVYLPETELTGKCCDLLNVPRDIIQVQFSNLLMDKRIVIKTLDGVNCIYSMQSFYEEQKCAIALQECREAFKGLAIDDAAEVQILQRLKDLELHLQLTMNEMQRQALLISIEKGIAIITGGPGTGKTTITRVLIQYYTEQGMDVLLAAPTGRAAKRMTEATGYEAKTIHRLLELTGTVSGEDENARFMRNEDNPLEADMIIIDEMSMVDIHLFSALLRAIVPGTRLIMTGDCNQLPSVGPGNVLKDLIDSGCIPTIKLEHIYRQAAESDIIVNAHRIKDGQDIAFDNHSRDFFFLERDSIPRIYKDIVLLIRDKLPPYVHAQSTEIQVLTPMRKGSLGVETLNTILQEQLNPPSHSKKEYERKEGIFRVGDKVMQTKNNYNAEWEICTKLGIVIDRGKGIFNGDVGTITNIMHSTREIKVVFDDGRSMLYPFQETEELELAYAMTIHKSQGSEYPAVILPIMDGPDLLLNRNLLYTAVTRGASCVVLMGSRDRVLRMIQNTGEHIRYSSLNIRLRELEPEH